MPGARRGRSRRRSASRDRDWLVLQQRHAFQPRRFLIEGIEGVGSGSFGCRQDHQVGKARAARAVVGSHASHIIRRFDG